MSNGNGKAAILETLKTILASQVGGWIIAVSAIGALSWWIIKDREMVYDDIHSLRDRAMPLIMESKAIAVQNQEAIEEAKTISIDNNRILQEIRSYMNLPLKNQKTLDDINRKLDRDGP